MKRLKYGLWLICTALSFTAWAEPAPIPGTQTRAWLALQKQAQPDQPPPLLPGEVADKVYLRYVNSFTYPIPEKYDFNSGSGRSNSGQTSR